MSDTDNTLKSKFWFVWHVQDYNPEGELNERVSAKFKGAGSAWTLTVDPKECASRKYLSIALHRHHDQAIVVGAGLQSKPLKTKIKFSMAHHTDGQPHKEEASQVFDSKSCIFLSKYFFLKKGLVEKGYLVSNLLVLRVDVTAFIDIEPEIIALLDSTLVDLPELPSASVLVKQFNNDLFSDVNIVASNKEMFHCHRVVLAASSKPFKVQLSKLPIDPSAKCQQLVFANDDPEVLQVFLRWLYGCKVGLPVRKLSQLWALAKRYEVCQLAASALNLAEHFLGTQPGLASAYFLDLRGPLADSQKELDLREKCTVNMAANLWYVMERPEYQRLEFAEQETLLSISMGEQSL